MARLLRVAANRRGFCRHMRWHNVQTNHKCHQTSVNYNFMVIYKEADNKVLAIALQVTWYINLHKYTYVITKLRFIALLADIYPRLLHAAIDVGVDRC